MRKSGVEAAEGGPAVAERSKSWLLFMREPFAKGRNVEMESFEKGQGADLLVRPFPNLVHPAR